MISYSRDSLSNLQKSESNSGFSFHTTSTSANMVYLFESSEKQSQHDIWTILLRALTADHPGITCKLDSELQKLCKFVLVIT
jgi:hypothetical protein